MTDQLEQPQRHYMRQYLQVETEFRCMCCVEYEVHDVHITRRAMAYAGLLATLRRRLSRRAAADGLRADSGDMSPLGSGAAAASFFRPLQSSSLTSDDERWVDTDP